MLRVASIVCFAGPAFSWSMPKFSWETLPVAFHSSSPRGPYSDEQLRNISKFATATFEKYQGLQHYIAEGYNWESCENGTDVTKCGCCLEDEMAGMGKRLKELNPSIMVFEYVNSQQVYPWYRLGHAVAARPDLWLHDEDGALVLAGAGHWVFPDFAKQEAQDMWHDAVLNLSRTGFVDGVFVDGCAQRPHNTSADRQAGKLAMLGRLQAALPGPAICGSIGKLEEGLAGSQVQNWGKGYHFSTREIPMLQRAVAAGALFQAHGICPKNATDPKFINNLASFLIAAGPYSYFVCGGWNSGPTEWYELYDRPLGEPLGDAVLSADGVWSRSFKHGVFVTFDTNTETGSISWGSAVSV